MTIYVVKVRITTQKGKKMLWPSQSIHFVWFPASSAQINVESLFRDLVGQEPDSIQQNKVPTANNPFLGQASKILDAFSVTLQLQPGRLELVFQPSAVSSSREQEDPLLDTKRAIEFGAAQIASSATLPDSSRLSVIANTIKVVDSKAAGGRLFAEIVGIDLNAELFTDQFFQVNRAKEMGGVRCNRLVQYSVNEQQSVMLQMSAQGLPVSPVMAVRYIMGVTFDFNTVPDGSIITAKDQRTIFSEISNEVMRAAAIRDLSFLKD